MSEPIKIPVHPDQMVMLEKTQYEINGLLPLVRQFASNSEFKVDAVAYEILLDRYTEKHTELEVIKSALIKEYAPEYTGGKYQFNFDFINSEITVTEFVCPRGDINAANGCNQARD